jgi:hypothetical protein
MNNAPLIPLALCLLLSACSPEGSGPKKIAIVGAKLDSIEHSIVIVEGMSIVAAGPQSSVPLPKDAVIVDGTGKTMEPAAAGSKIEIGQTANLILKDATSARTMKDGQWQN